MGNRYAIFDPKLELRHIRLNLTTYFLVMYVTSIIALVLFVSIERMVWFLQRGNALLLDKEDVATFLYLFEKRLGEG